MEQATEKLTALLAALRATQWSHWTSHWQVSGSYGDHILLERLYSAITEEIDTLAEKVVSYYGPSSVDPVRQAEVMTNILKRHSVPDPILRALRMEQVLQAMFLETNNALEALGQMSLGLNDYIASAANAHETAIYLLQQRLK